MQKNKKNNYKKQLFEEGKIVMLSANMSSRQHMK